VIAVREEFKMRDVDAMDLLASVVNIEAFGWFAVVLAPNDSMNMSQTTASIRLRTRRYCRSTVWFCERARPEMAAGLLVDDRVVGYAI
jgi:hypothetical protein